MQNALITASTKGIGRAIAVAFAREGVNLAVCSRNADDLNNFRKELLTISPHIKVVTSVTDCSLKQQLINFAFKAENALGTINIIVNNVGYFKPSAILDDSEDSLQKNVDGNLMPAYELYRYFGKKLMAAGAGHIFNICSAVSVGPIAEAGAYSVTKYALAGLTKVMKLELQPAGVKVTAVIPGSTLTGSWEGMEDKKDRMILPEDIASAIINSYKLSAGANVDEIIIKPVYGQIK